jgi:hypothetical protein
VIECDGMLLRIHADVAAAQPAAILLPLDPLFEQRAAAAIRLWRGLTHRKPAREMAAFSEARRSRLILALRALDGHVDHTSYRQIAEALFGLPDLSRRAWKTHDLRDRTIRLVRVGTRIMQGGYRRLLIWPCRSTDPQSTERGVP